MDSNKFETSILKLERVSAGFFWESLDKKLSLRTTLANQIASQQHVATMYQYLVVGVRKEGRILISPQSYLNRQYPLLELR